MEQFDSLHDLQGAGLTTVLHRFVDSAETPERKAWNQRVAIMQTLVELALPRSASIKKQAIVLLHDFGIITAPEAKLVLKHSKLVEA